MSTRVYAYIRVSGAGQVEKDGPERQRAAIKEFCERHGLIIDREFFEAGVTGTKDSMERPGLSQLFFDCANGPVRALVVEKLDRLARDLVVQEVILNRCLGNGVRVFVSDHGDLVDVANCSNDPMRKVIRQFVGAMAEFDKANIVMRCGEARRRIRETAGRCEGRKPYGFTPGEAKILEIMIEDYKQSGSCDYVAERLNERGIPSRMGKSWNKATVYKILKRHRELVGQRKPLRIL